MRRNTLTPARSRLSIAPSLNSSVLSSRRNVRDSCYQMDGISIINEYISRIDSNINLLEIGKCPSFKEFQMLFKLIVSFFYRNLEIKSFQEEAFSIIRSLKYPFASELNKSHLITTNPHSWPVILAFLRWVVEMINFVEEYENQIDEHIELLLNGYIKFMEGKDSYFEDTYKEKIDLENEHINKQIKMKNEEKESLMKEIEDFKNKKDGTFQLNVKMNDLLADKKSIETNSINLESKKKKYQELIEKLNIEISEMKIDAKKEEKYELQKRISEQKLNASDIDEMATRKKKNYDELEKIKKNKENSFKTLNEIERDILEQEVAIEKYESEFFNLMNDKENIDLSNLSLHESDNVNNSTVEEFKTKNTPDSISFNNISIKNSLFDHTLSNRTNKQIYNMIDSLNNKISSLEESIIRSKEGNSENVSLIQSLKNEIIMKQKRIFNLSKLYLEKKELYDLGKKKSISEMNKIESEIMILSVESGNKLLHSEQELQYKIIKIEKIKGDITLEENEIKLIISKFYNEMVAELDQAQEIVENQANMNKL